MDLLIAAGCDVACDQCKFGDERTGCREACVQLAWIVCVRSGCPGACGQIKVDDKLMHDADEVMVIADAAWVVRNAMDVSPLHNSFVETQEAMMVVLLKVLRFMMGVSCCCVVVCGCRECCVVVKADVLYEQRLFGCREACGHGVSGGAPGGQLCKLNAHDAQWCRGGSETSRGKSSLSFKHPRLDATAVP